jgi:hypothetical protein
MLNTLKLQNNFYDTFILNIVGVPLKTSYSESRLM